MGCHFLLKEIFPSQDLKLGLQRLLRTSFIKGKVNGSEEEGRVRTPVEEDKKPREGRAGLSWKSLD